MLVIEHVSTTWLITPALNKLWEIHMSDTIFKVVVLISGRGSNLESILSYQSKHPSSYRVVGVVSDKESAPGLDIAKAHNVPTRVVTRRAKEITLEQFSKELAETVAELSPDLVVLAGFMRIVDSSFVGAFRQKIINIHPSLLPAFRGLHAQQQAIDSGVRIAGCSVHFVNEEMDAGPIIAQAAVPVYAHDDADSLSSRILTRDHLLLPTVIHLIAQGKISWEKEGFRNQIRISSFSIDAIRDCNNSESILSFG